MLLFCYAVGTVFRRQNLDFKQTAATALMLFALFKLSFNTKGGGMSTSRETSKAHTLSLSLLVDMSYRLPKIEYMISTGQALREMGGFFFSSRRGVSHRYRLECSEGVWNM